MLLTLDKIRSQVRILKCYCFCGATEQLYLCASLYKIRNSRLLKHHASFKKQMMDKVPKKKTISEVQSCSVLSFGFRDP